MSTSEFDGRNDRLSVSRYAPPQYRTSPDEATISPILERLSRGASHDNPNPETAQAVPPIEPIQIQQPHDRPSSLTIPLSMTGRLAVAMSLVAVVTAVSVTFFKSRAEHPAPVAAAQTSETSETSPNTDMSKPDVSKSDLPKTVHTIAVRPETTTVGDAHASAATEQTAPPIDANPSVADRIEAIGMTPQETQKEPQAGSALALTEPLTLWTMYPAAPGAGPWGSSAVPPDANAVKDAPSPKASVPHREAKAVTPNRRHRRHTARRRTRPQQTRSAAATPQQAAAPEEQANAAEPSKKFPLQAAIDALFGNSGSSNDAASNSAAPAHAPASTGAAFR